MPVTTFTLKVPSTGYEKTISLTVNEKPNFTVFTEPFLSEPESINYNLDRYIKEDTQAGSITKCTRGRELYDQYYLKNRIRIGSEDYIPSYLRMFEKHKEKTGKEVLLSLKITYNDRDKLIKDKITLDYDASLFEIGFTDDGATINTKEFVFEKKYFTEDFYTIPVENKNSENYFDVFAPTSNDPTDKEPFMIHKLLIRCKKGFSEEQKVTFLNKKGQKVGLLIIKPTTEVYHSKRKFRFIKVFRKSHKENDFRKINRDILKQNVRDEKYKSIDFELLTKTPNDFDENIRLFYKYLCNNYYSRLRVVYPPEIEIEEMEIEDISFADENFYKQIRHLYIDKKQLKEEEYKNLVLVFLSPLEYSNHGAAISYDNIYMFSMIVYILSSESVLHETAHKMGLPHIFEDQYIDESIGRTIKSVKTSKENCEEWISKYQKMKGNTITFGTETITKAELEKRIKAEQKNIPIKEQMLEFLQKMKRYHQIYFAEGTSDSIMDSTNQKFGFFEFQFEIIKKLNDEYHHI